MTNIEKFLKQDIEKFADLCANTCCFRNGKLNITSTYLCGDCEFGNHNKTCNKIALKRYLLSESEG